MPNDYYCFIIMALSRIISVTDDILKCIEWNGICTSLLIIVAQVLHVQTQIRSRPRQNKASSLMNLIMIPKLTILKAV